MTFSFDLSDELKATIRILEKKDKKTLGILNKKIKQIISSDERTIEHYKNLRHSLADYKRAHIAKSFVLLFKVSKKEGYILFDKFKHHDDAYK
ncbi:MAG: addiction module toxin RelE [Candidatus Diapherotrites archaeon]|nr:addiction module toxin RelE [Candidatus Diapherotrites archaeon]